MNCSQAGGQLAALHDGELDAAVGGGAARSRRGLPALPRRARRPRAARPRHPGAGAAPRGAGGAACARSRRARRDRGRRGDGRPRGRVDASASRPARARSARAASARTSASALVRRRCRSPARCSRSALGAATLAFVQRQANDEVALEAVDNHVRATLAHRLVAVISSDRHTVKPWLSARLDYAAPVFDLPDSGFALAGARIDSLDRRPVATLVYRYGNHVVDVFVRPLAPGATRAAARHRARLQRRARDRRRHGVARRRRCRCGRARALRRAARARRSRRRRASTPARSGPAPPGAHNGAMTTHAVDSPLRLEPPRASRCVLMTIGGSGMYVVAVVLPARAGRVRRRARRRLAALHADDDRLRHRRRPHGPPGRPLRRRCVPLADRRRRRSARASSLAGLRDEHLAPSRSRTAC